MRPITLAIAALALLATACTKQEHDLPTSPHTPGTLGITALTIDGQGAAPISRAGMEDPTATLNSPNTAIIALTDGDVLTVGYYFGADDYNATATLGTNGTWTLTANNNAPLRPTATNETWTDANMEMQIQAKPATGSTYDPAARMHYTQSDNATVGNLTNKKTRSYYDALFATSSYGTGETEDDGITPKKGEIAIDRTLTSPTLGAVRASLAHPGALMRLKPADMKIDGEAPTTAKQLKNLWAKVKSPDAVTGIGIEYYVPFTEVTVAGSVGKCYQAIIPGGATVLGFVTVVGNKADELDNKTLTTDLATPGKVLTANLRYPLKMNVTTTIKSEITFTAPDGIPGWGAEGAETELIDWSKHLVITNGEGNTPYSYSVLSAKGLLALSDWINGADAPAPASPNKTILVSQADRCATNITLASNITMPAVGENGINWAPINGNNNNYTGTFDGKGHTITGLTSYSGLFNGALGWQGTVKNLSFAEVKIDGDNCFAITTTNLGNIENCHVVSGSIVATSTELMAGQAGGLVGTNMSTITACSNQASISGKNSAGGIAVTFGGSSTITGCWNSGSVSSSTGTTFTIAPVGGTINGCWGNPDKNASGGYDRVTDYTPLNAAVPTMNTALVAAKVELAWSTVTIPATELPTVVVTKLPDPEPEPDPSQSGLESYDDTKGYTVSNATGLVAIQQWLNTAGASAPKAVDGKKFEGDNKAKVNITLSHDITMPLNNNWTPINVFFAKNYYVGTFDGGGKTVTGINSNGGLFKTLSNGGVIKNLTLASVKISTNSDDTGALAATNKGSIINCHVSGTISATNNKNVGGIVWRNEGLIAACSNQATITSDNSGGIAASNSGSDGGIITGCWNTGAISGSSASSIASYSGGEINGCYGKNPMSNSSSSTPITALTDFTALNAEVPTMNTELDKLNLGAGIGWSWTAGTPAESKLPTITKKQ